MPRCEPFYTTREVGHGTGLGLSQAIGFARQSGGDIVVDSETGRGATFTLYLPRVAAAMAMPGDAAPAAIALPARAATVLVVEDNAEVGRFAQQALAELGHRGVLATNADAALTLLAQDRDRFDLVFSDVVMPGRSGIDLGKLVRREHPGLPVLLTSGYSADLAESSSDGFALLRKPYSIENLAAAIAAALNGEPMEGRLQ